MVAPRQLSLLGEPMALADLTVDPGADYGEVFTRRWVVEMILDLVGYTADEDLSVKKLVEPSCGSGAFLLPVVERLISSAIDRGVDLESLGGAIQAFDLLDANAALARKAVALRLEEAGAADSAARRLAKSWITTADFLLTDHEVRTADYVVGNPPYIRLENVHPIVMEQYRRRCPTMRGRADIYVGFIEAGLDLLKDGGALGFICADRWMRNQYGADLREHISRHYAVDTVIAMHDVDAFEDEVSAYPAVVVLRNEPQGRTVVADTTASFTEGDGATLAAFRQGRRRTLRKENLEASRLEHWFEGRGLWPSGSPSQLALVADLEDRFPPLENPSTGTRVGIGVATGCDELFITSDPDLVEESQLLPLLQAKDIASGSVNWSGEYLVNPWNGTGLVDLDRCPQLAAYLREHEARLRQRHIAQKNPGRWYRTIDRVHAELTNRPKLLLPDMKAASHPVLDEGGYYPHHNLYCVVSDTWDLEVLGGLMLSDIANLFVGAYCVKMRGGTYRFQAQYLRTIRVPHPSSISPSAMRELSAAFRGRDTASATAVACSVYGVSPEAI